MTKMRKILVAVVAVLAVVLIASVVVFVFQGKKEKMLSSSLKSAANYYSEGNYEDAVDEYKKAIKADSKEEDAYIGLADTYTAMGESDNAIDTLEDGYEETHSISIKLMIDDLQNGGTADHTLLSELSATSYGDYESSRGIEKETVIQDGVLVRMKGISADYIFQNTAIQPKAVSNGKVNENSMPAEIQMDEIMSIFGGGETITKEQIEELDVTNMIQTEDEEQGTIIQFQIDNCQISIACDEDGTVHSGAWNKILPLGSQGESNFITVQGNVIDSYSNKNIQGVELSFCNKETKETKTAITSSAGAYNIELESGLYEVTVSGGGYSNEVEEVEIKDSQMIVYQDFYLQSELVNGEARVVLEWGIEPKDLDLYIFGDTDDGSYVNAKHSNKEVIGSDGDLKAKLDYDARDSGGPETITIYDLDGVYDFIVADYNMTKNMKNSGATITIYLPGQAPTVIDLSRGYITNEGNIWQAITIDHGKVVDIEKGTITYS